MHCSNLSVAIDFCLQRRQAKLLLIDSFFHILTFITQQINIVMKIHTKSQNDIVGQVANLIHLLLSLT